MMQPAKLFERRYGVTNISEDYILPDSLKPYARNKKYTVSLGMKVIKRIENLEIEDYPPVSEIPEAVEIRQQFDALVALNKESLSSIASKIDQDHINGIAHMAEVINGVFSAINHHDIEVFLDYDAAREQDLSGYKKDALLFGGLTLDKAAEQIEKITSRQETFWHKYPSAREWSISQHTMHLIEQQLADKARPASDGPLFPRLRKRKTDDPGQSGGGRVGR